MKKSIIKKGIKILIGSTVLFGVAFITPHNKISAADNTVSISDEAEKNTLATLESVQLNQVKLSLKQGEKYQLSVLNTEEKVTWKVNRKSVALVDKNGTVTAVAPGTTTVIARVGDKEYKCTVKVSKQNVMFTQNSVTLRVGEPLQLEILGYYKNVTWKINRKTIASVDRNGVLTGVKAGTTTVKAIVDGKTLSCSVKVIKNKVALNKNRVLLFPGDEIQLKLSGYYKDLIWNSSSADVVVSQDGLVKIADKAAAQGAIVTAIAEGKSYQCTISVEAVRTFNSYVFVYDMIRIPITGTTKDFRVYSTNPNIGEILGIDKIDGVTYVRVLGKNIGETKICVEVEGHIFASKIKYSNNVDYASGHGVYTGLSEEDAKLAEQQYVAVSAIADEIIAEDMSEIEKVRAIHDWLIHNVKYDYVGVENNIIPAVEHKLEGVLVERTAVCDGYAKAFRALCEKAGMSCFLIYGTGASGISHAWNVVKVDGKWYQIDTTWDDTEANARKLLDTYYEYFLLSDEKMSETHIWNQVFPKATENYESEQLEQEIRQQYEKSGYFYNDREKVIAKLAEQINSGVQKATVATTMTISDTITANDVISKLSNAVGKTVYVSYMRHRSFMEIVLSVK